MEIKDIDLLVWDVDGVLMFVRESYRRAIVETVQYYLSELAGLKLEKEIVTAADTQRFKLIEGFNDDWRVTYACVLCLLAKIVSGVDGKDLPNSPVTTQEEKLARIKALGTLAGISTPDLNFENVTNNIKMTGSGLEATERALDEMFGDLENARLFYFPDIIKKVFQEKYLGDTLYREKYGYDPVFVRGPGLMRHETPIISSKTFKKLDERFYMGIASGRERFEIEESLRENGFDAFIPLELIVSAEDVSKGKPDPESLLECRHKLIDKYGLEEGARAMYVGDSIDDVRASKNAGFYSVGCLSASPDVKERERLRKEFKKLGCDLILKDANDLACLVD